MKTVVLVFSEWNIGEEGVAFSSQASAETWVQAALTTQGDTTPLEELMRDGLIEFVTVPVL